MPNGQAINEELEFNDRIKKMTGEERSIYTAQEVYRLAIKYDNLDKKMDGFTNPKRTSIASGGIAGFTLAAIVAIVDYFVRR